MILSISITGCMQTGDEPPKDQKPVAVEKPTDGMFVHISSNDARKVLMGLSIALKMQEDKDVLVFFDSEAINTIVKEGDQYEMEGYAGSSDEMIRKLTQKGVPVLACPMCLKSFGKSQTDLVEGITIARKEQFFDFTEGRILTLDY